MISVRPPAIYISRTPVVYKPKLSRAPLRPIKASFLSDLNTVTYFAGKSVILFTMFYCTLNWAHYRQLRKDQEDNNNTKNGRK